MQYLNYALQTSTRLLTSQSNNHSQTAAQEEAAEAEDQIAHACCSRGAQLLRLRQQELAKRRALELEDQLNANAIRSAQDENEEDSESSSETEEGAVGGHQYVQKSSESGRQPVQ